MTRAFIVPAALIALSVSACVAYVPPDAVYPAAPPYAGYQGQPVPLAQAQPVQPPVVYQNPAPYYPAPYYYAPGYYGPAYYGPSVGFYFGGGGHRGGWRH